MAFAMHQSIHLHENFNVVFAFVLIALENVFSFGTNLGGFYNFNLNCGTLAGRKIQRFGEKVPGRCMEHPTPC